MKNSFYLIGIIVFFLAFTANSQVIEKRQKVQIPEEAKIIDFYYDGNDYYVLYEESSTEKPIKKTGRSTNTTMITSLQKLIFNGQEIVKFKRIYSLTEESDFFESYEYLNEKTNLDIKLYTDLILVRYMDEKGSVYLYFNKNKLGPFQDGFFYDVTNHSEPIYSFKKNKKWFINIGTELLGPFDDIKEFDWNKEIDSYCLVYKSNKKYFLKTKYQEYGGYDEISSYDIKKLNNKLLVIIIATIGKNRYLVINNNQLGPFQYVSNDIYFTKDNQPIIRAKIGNQWFVFKGNEKIGPFDDIYQFKFFEKFDMFTFSAKIENKEYFYIDDNKFGPFEEFKYHFSEDNKKLIYAAKLNNKWYIYKNNENIGTYDYIGALVYLKNQDKLFYKAKINEKYYVFYGNEKRGPYDYLDFASGEGLEIEESLVPIPYIYKINDKWYLNVLNKQFVFPESDEDYFINFNSFTWDDSKTKFAFLVTDGYNAWFFEMDKILPQIELKDYRIQEFEIKWEPTVKDFLLFYKMADESYVSTGVDVYLKGKNIFSTYNLEYVKFVNNNFVGKISNESDDEANYSFGDKITFFKGEQEVNYLGNFIDDNSFYYYDDKKGELVYVRF